MAELRTVRAVVSTLHHEINNPLQVILLSADRLQSLQSFESTCVEDIAVNSTRIRDVVAKLGSLEDEVRLQEDLGFAGLIDVARSR